MNSPKTMRIGEDGPPLHVERINEWLSANYRGGTLKMLEDYTGGKKRPQMSIAAYVPHISPAISRNFHLLLFLAYADVLAPATRSFHDLRH
ncbi:hypothetical protein [Singulisphaera sp. GP187]|uniref:hypothetical protein n=1 Tax=Singulisphaera sp. GP187 TaxID=1882752 RepID=UPI0011612364|nr:hypothetical protein [Singulisphaera sp. GP187]